jgi:predicted nucleotidyltransferase
VKRYLPTTSIPDVRALVAALQRDADVEIAVVIGSRARGTADVGSDLDLLVGLREPSKRRWEVLRDDLEIAAGIKVDLCNIVAWAQVPAWWTKAIQDKGDVLVDRRGWWPSVWADPELVRSRLLRPFEALEPHDREVVHRMRQGVSFSSPKDRLAYLTWCAEHGLPRQAPDPER